MKNNHNIPEILDQIRIVAGEGFVADEAAIIKESESNDAHKSGPALKILSIIGGVIASLAFFGFLFLAGLYSSEEGMVLFGVVCVVGSVLLIRFVNNLVMATSAVSFYIVGLCLIGAGSGFLHVGSGIVCLIFASIALVVMFFTQNWIFGFISVLTINGSVIGLILLNRNFNNINIYVPVSVLIFLWVTMNEAKMLRFGPGIAKLYEPIRAGVLVSMIAGLILVGVRDLISLDYRMIWFSAIATIGGVVFLVWKLLPVLRVENAGTKILVYALSVLMFVPTVSTPALSGSMLIILACFYVNYKPGFVIGVLAFIYFLSQFYYDLHLTLLVKSGILMLSGLIFIICYLVTVKKLKHHEEV